MLALALAALLSAAPFSLETWSTQACPPSSAPPDSNVELKFKEQQRAECLRKAMGRALERILAPLKKSPSAAPPEWLALQADYQRWLTDACAALEDANWVDPSTGERSMGTGYGFTESQCLQRQYAWRGFQLDAWARAERDPLLAFAEWKRAESPTRLAWQSYRERIRQASSQALALPGGDAAPSRKLSREDWRLYMERLDRVLALPATLAARQCALVPSPVEDCAPRLAESLFAQMDAPHPPVSAEGRP